MNPDIVTTAILTAAVTALLNWGALKAIVNGTVLRVARMEEKLDTVVEDVAFLKGMHSLDKEGDPS